LLQIKQGLGISLIPNFPYDDSEFKEHGQYSKFIRIVPEPSRDSQGYEMQEFVGI
jgi:hypothetical protein